VLDKALAGRPDPAVPKPLRRTSIRHGDTVTGGIGHPAWLLAAAIVFAAATLNGVLGHGFSTLCVPLAMAVLVPRVLNPVLVVLGVALNAASVLACRSRLPGVWGRVKGMAAALVPGILLGSAGLLWGRTGFLRAATCAILLVLVLGQGLRRRPGRRREGLVGFGAGLIYGISNLSGPFMGFYFQGRGLGKGDYRASISLIKLVEAALAAVAYLALGLVTRATLRLALPVLPCVIVGPLVGAWLSRWVSETLFVQVAGSFNVFALSFGLCRTLAPAWGCRLPWAVAAAAVLGYGCRRRWRTAP